MFSGSYVALITPFKDGRVDVARLRELVEFQIANGTNGLVPCGTTGETATMTEEEDELVIGTVVEVAAGRVPVLAGTGSNDTRKAIQYTRNAERVGANGALVVAPYYNKPTQEGVYLHYKAIAESTDLPIVMYNIQGRTGINMAPETIARLAQIENIIGVKEASGNLEQIANVVKLCGPAFDVLSGDDTLTLPIMAVGGVGVISVVANIYPRPVADMCAAFLQGDLKRARERYFHLFGLCKAMFIETNPIPVKTAAALMGMCSPELRLPMSPMAEGNVRKLQEVLQEYKLVK
ncbi:MAG: 4-hydroxy-tetrahydrodipicolinate synthase [Chloroflexi bacterium]|nr:4-hydroxy-tetrahydrodipicolinate synthase [Chloroflexota bacterium]